MVGKNQYNYIEMVDEATHMIQDYEYVACPQEYLEIILLFTNCEARNAISL